MSAIQFELERLYDLVKETQEQRDLLSSELDKVHDVLETTRGDVEELRTENERFRMHILKLENDNYALNHRLECLMEINHTTYEYFKNMRKQNKLLVKQIETLTDGTIKYKKVVDPDDLEEYFVKHKSYLRDVLTDAIYSRRGKLIGYLEEGSGDFIKIKGNL
jgi:hypothetical protein